MFRNVYVSRVLIVRTLKNKFTPEVANKVKPKYLFDFYNWPAHIHTHPIQGMMDQNSRHIAVEGNVGTGKGKLAQKLADYFGMLYVDDVSEEDLHVIPLGKAPVDLRKYNDMLPPYSRVYTREMLFNDKDPIHNGRPLLLQKHIYLWRYFNTCKAMCNIYNTGQGFVQKRSVWSDHVMALTLNRQKMLSDSAYKFYKLIRGESLPNLLRPNFIVYLKGTPDKIKSNLAKESKWEATASRITDEFLETYDEIFQNVFLSDISKSSKVFTVDISELDIDDEEDFTYIAESIAKMNRDYKQFDDFDMMFKDWRDETHNTITLHINRKHWSFARKCFAKGFREIRIPFAVPEGCYSQVDRERFTALFKYDERVQSDTRYSPKYSSLMDIVMPKIQANYNNFIFTPSCQILKAYEEYA